MAKRKKVPKDAKHLAEYDRLVDQAFALDKEEPFFGQTVESREPEPTSYQPVLKPKD